MVKLKLYLVTLFALIVSTTTWGQEDSDLRSKANALFIKEDYTEATQLYLQLLSLNPKDIELNFRYGVCLLHNSDNKSEAIRYLNYVVKEDPSRIDAFFFLGKVYHLGYNFEQARSYYSQYIQKAGPKGKYLQEANRNILMTRNGEKLLSHITDIHVKEKLEVKKDNFYRGYSLDDVGGSLIQAVDFQSKVDKKKKHKPIVHILPTSDLVYFSSYGDGDNLDIYVIRRLPDGKYGSAQKIKGEVNTDADEDFPYMHPNGKELFFSSKGHNSMGGYDIFRSTLDPENNQFTDVNNIDFAISSPDDDLLYIVDKDYKNAYFASNRQAKNGMISLYKVSVDRFPSALVILKGTFNSKINKDYKQITIDVFDDQTNRKIGRFQTNEQGDYIVVLPRGGKYVFKSSSNQFAGNFSQVVEVPYLDAVKPLRQYAEHSSKDNGSTILFVNAFDERVENSSDVIAEALKLKGNLSPNEAPVLQKEISNLSSTLSKATQQVGLPDWSANTLFSHIDELGSKYVNEAEKLANLSGILNATVFSELQKIEKIDLQLISLSQQLGESSSNTQERSIQERINQLNDQRQESLKWIDILESNRSKIQDLYESNTLNDAVLVDEIHQMVTELHVAKGQGEDAFVKTLLKYEKQIKLLNKETNTIYKKVISEKAVFDRKEEQFSLQDKTNKSRLKELNEQLNQLNETYESAKSKQKVTIENQIERITNEVTEITSNLELLQKQIALLQVKRDSIVKLLQAIGRVEQYRGTPVSSKMLNTAQLGFTNSDVTQGKLNTNTAVAQNIVDAKFLTRQSDLKSIRTDDENKIEDKENALVNVQEVQSYNVNKATDIANNLFQNKTEVPNEIATNSVVTSEIEKKNTTTPVATTGELGATISNNQKKEVESVLPERATNATTKTRSEFEKTGTAINEIGNVTESNSRVIPDGVMNQSNISVDVDQENGVSASQRDVQLENSYIFVAKLSEEAKDYLKGIDKNYLTRVEKLEQRKLNAGEQRVLIDLHRKFLDKIEEQQGQITFQERKPLMEGELQLLELLNAQITQSIQQLNKHLSDEMDEEKPTNVKDISIVKANTISEINQVVTKTADVNAVISQTDVSSLSNIQAGETKNVNKITEIGVQIEQNQQDETQKDVANSSVNNVNPENNLVNQNDVISDVSKSTTTQSPEILGLKESRVNLTNQVIEARQALDLANTKKEKKVILDQIQSLERELDTKLIALNDLYFDLLFQDYSLKESGDLSELENSYVQRIDQGTANYQKEKDVIEKRALSEKRVELVEELNSWSDYQKQVDYLEVVRRETSTVISQKELGILANYLAVKQGDLEQLVLSNQKWQPKKKVDKLKKKEQDMLLSDLLFQNEALLQDIKVRIKQERKYLLDPIVSNHAPTFVEEYKILASEEYEAFATLKQREQELNYSIQLLTINLDEKRDYAHRLYFEKPKSELLRSTITEIEGLEATRAARSTERDLLMKELIALTPKDTSTASYFNNLVQRGVNPIIHKQVQGDLVEIGTAGIQFSNDPNSLRKDITLSTAKGLVYRIQVGAFKNAIGSHIFSEFSPVTTEMMSNSNVKRYIAGYFPSIAIAKEAQEQIHALGYNDAFLVAYCDGERVTIAKAKELEREGTCSVGYIENISFEINKEIRDKAVKIDRNQVDLSSINPNDYNKGLGIVLAEPLEEYSGLFFTVQVGVYNRPTTAERFHNQKPLYTVRAESGQIRYSVGMYSDLSLARVREKELRSIGLKDAYVVAYYNGERITLSKALDLMDSGVVPGFTNKAIPPTVTKEASTIVKEEVVIFKSTPKPVIAIEKAYIQLISIDSFTAVPVDFLDRFRAKSYFYFDHVDGRVKSQIVEKHHYLFDMESLRKFFYIDNDQLRLTNELNSGVISITLEQEKIPAELADFILRISNRTELKQLDKGMEIHIFVKDEKDSKRLENGLKSMGYSSKKILKTR